jgi:hypothetical protein
MVGSDDEQGAFWDGNFEGAARLIMGDVAHKSLECAYLVLAYGIARFRLTKVAGMSVGRVMGAALASNRYWFSLRVCTRIVPVCWWLEGTWMGSYQ